MKMDWRLFLYKNVSDADDSFGSKMYCTSKTFLFAL